MIKIATDICTLNIPARIRNVLVKNGYKSVEQLTEDFEKEPLLYKSLDGVGKTMTAKIAHALSDFHGTDKYADMFLYLAISENKKHSRHLF